jgi:hypothetical protein
MYFSTNSHPVTIQWMELINIDSSYAIDTKCSANAGHYVSLIISSSPHIFQENDTIDKIDMEQSPFHMQHSMVNESNKTRDRQDHK